MRRPVSFLVAACLGASIAHAQEAEWPGQSEIPQLDYSGLHVIQVGNRFGFIDATGKEVIAPRFAWATDPAMGYWLVWVSDSSPVCNVDLRGQIRFGCAPKSRGGDIPDMNLVSDERWVQGGRVYRPDGSTVTGIGGRTNVKVIDDRYRDGFIRVEIGNEATYADTGGNLLLKPQFRAAAPFSDSLAAVRIFDKWGYLDRAGRLAIEPQFETRPGDFQAGKAFVNGCGALIDKAGRTIATFVHVDSTAKRKVRKYSCDVTDAIYEDGLWRVMASGDDDVRGSPQALVAFIDNQGREVLRVRWGFSKQSLDVGTFSEGLAPIVQFATGLTGFMDKTGRLVIPARFKVARAFDRGLARVIEDGREGYIDRTGNYVWRQPLLR